MELVIWNKTRLDRGVKNQISRLDHLVSQPSKSPNPSITKSSAFLVALHRTEKNEIDSDTYGEQHRAEQQPSCLCHDHPS
jgi:hypothetical protein